MRKLTKAQKHILNKALEEDPSIQEIENLPTKTMETIKKISDHETLNTDITRYILDWRFSEQFN